MTSHRDAITGEFVTAEHAEANPDTTVSESPCTECERLRAELPIVRTVGDLTARHIGRRVRLDERYDAKLETIFAHDGGEVSLNFTHPEGFAFGCSRSPDTPCEVLS